MENSRLREAAPTSVNVTVRQRSREYLTDREVERLIEAAKQNRSGHRDATAILVAYRHGLRASECRRGSLSHHGDQCEKVILLILSLLKIISGRSYDVIRTELAW